MVKTNVMRLLAAAKIPFEAREYAFTEDDLSGTHTAGVLGVPPQRLFKTLVLRGARTGVFVCCIPADGTIDLRKAAHAASDKKAEMLPMKELLPITGYVRGGCSPIGMKRKFPLFVDASCVQHERIMVSAGARGAMVELPVQALLDYTGAACADLTETEGTH